MNIFFFFFSSRRRHTRWPRDWSSDVCSSDLLLERHPYPGKQPREDPTVRVGQSTPHEQGARGARQADGGKVELPLMGVAVLTGQSDLHQPLPRIRRPGNPTRALSQAGQIIVTDVEIDIDRVDLVDRGQDGACT